ncbi:MAG: S8 family peptidase, partial [Vicinamibacterales bacterium]
MTLRTFSKSIVSELSPRRRKVVWGLPPWMVAIILVLLWASTVLAAPAQRFRKLDPELSRRARVGASRSTQVVVTLKPGATLPPNLQRFVRGRKLRLIDGYVLDLPDSQLEALETLPQVSTAHQDRPVWAADFLSTRATAANVVQQSLGYTGAGVGVAVIDSGVATWHDDLTAQNPSGYPYGNQRVTKFVDFVNGQTLPYDDHGHGSHVAGIILGNGYDSNGRHAGIAPDASLVALKVLDGQGRGTISTVLAALDWIEDNGADYNIRVVNLSVGAAVTQSYWLDPLTLAAKRLTDRGIVVVAAAGNLGRNTEGEQQYGGIVAPGNAPWVLTVGASSTGGTVGTYDDTIASFSSLGPTRGDYLAKPDLVAPGHGIISLAAPGSSLAIEHPELLVGGQSGLASPPYLSLSGTSMAAPQVAGAVALMLEANPQLTPNLVKAILQYTARVDDSYNLLQQGAGFMNALGAVRLSEFYASNEPNRTMPVHTTWSQHIIWGNYRLTGGYISPLASAWAENIVWGTAASDAQNIVWGTQCDQCTNIVWSTADANGSNIVWGTASNDNIVWGTASADNIVWGTASADNIVWGTAGSENIVWGTASYDNIVWGTDCGGANCTQVIWGTASADNIVWGTASPYDNIVWGTASEAENIVWGTASNDNIVWGTAGSENIVWGTADP